MTFQANGFPKEVREVKSNCNLGLPMATNTWNRCNYDMNEGTYIFPYQCCKGKYPFIHDIKLACVIAVKKMRNTGGIMLYRKVSYRTISSKSFLRNFLNFWICYYLVDKRKNEKTKHATFLWWFYSRKTTKNWLDIDTVLTFVSVWGSCRICQFQGFAHQKAVS